MHTRLRFLLPLMAVSFFGFGCSWWSVPQVPRVPLAPPPVTQQTQPATQPESIPATTSTQTAATTTVSAFLRVDAPARAEVTRGDETVSGVTGMELLSGDRVRDVSGEVYVIYPALGMSRLEEGTEVEVAFTAGTSTSVVDDIQLMAGRIWTRLERLLGSGESFSVTGNGVVTTVRGTAFGVALHAKGVDVQVADHAVEVYSVRASSTASRREVKISAGQGVTIEQPDELEKTPLARMAKLVRPLTPEEQAAPGFVFAKRRLEPSFIQVPPEILRMDQLPRIQRLPERPRLLNEAGFVLPNRLPTLDERIPTVPTSTIQNPLLPPPSEPVDPKLNVLLPPPTTTVKLLQVEPVTILQPMVTQVHATNPTIELVPNIDPNAVTVQMPTIR